jgi:hypothetical protein
VTRVNRVDMIGGLRSVMRARIRRYWLVAAVSVVLVAILSMGLAACSQNPATTTSTGRVSGSAATGTIDTSSVGSLGAGGTTTSLGVALGGSATSITDPASTTTAGVTTTTADATTTTVDVTTTTTVKATTTTTAKATTTTVKATTTTTAGTSSTMTTVADYRMTVKGAFGQKTYTIDALHSFPQFSETIEGKPSSGPRLLDVLTDAGVTDFTQVTLSGLRGGIDVLTKDQASATDCLLSFTQRGTVKVVTTVYTSDQWTKDVTLIVVE